MGVLVALFVMLTLTQVRVIENPSVIPVLTFQETDGAKKLFVSGSGVLIDNVRGYIVSANHIAQQYPDKAGMSRMAIVHGNAYPLTVVWVHKTADLAVMKFSDSAKGDLASMQPFRTRNEPTRIDEKVRAVGWTGEVLQLGPGCIKTKEKDVCQVGVDLNVSMVDVPMINISPPDAREELNEYFRKAGVLAGSIPFEDVIFASFLVTGSETHLGRTVYGGMSGGALCDAHHALLGITVSRNAWYSVFIPAREIPKEYFAKAP